eukprot:2808092-Pyramimonas_sp.AAC.1
MSGSGDPHGSCGTVWEAPSQGSLLGAFGALLRYLFLTFLRCSWTTSKAFEGFGVSPAVQPRVPTLL